jgi:large subunit ribosomal protein L21
MLYGCSTLLLHDEDFAMMSTYLNRSPIPMYAIIETGSKQLWVVPGETVKVEKLEAKAGDKLEFKALWAVGDAKEGQEPSYSQKAKVTATVVKQDRGPKIIVFKKRTKKAYKRRQGHRQWLTYVKIENISLN